MVDNDVPLVFIHGLKGARLVSPSRGVLWVDPGLLVKSSTTGTPRSGSPASFGPASPSAQSPLSSSPSPSPSRFFSKFKDSAPKPVVDRTLASPLEWAYDAETDMYTQAKDDVVVDGLVLKVMWRRVYGPMVDFGKQHCLVTGRTFHVFTYDWRRDNWEHIKAFEEFLDGILNQEPKKTKGCQVIAHSNGGAITYALLQKRPDLFHSICFASVPFRPGVYGMPDLHVGNKVGFNKTLLSADVLFSFACPWPFSPLKQDNQTWLVDEKGIPLEDEYDAYSPETWRSLKFSVFSDPNITPEREAQCMAHLKAALHQAKKFRETFMSPTNAIPCRTVPIVVLGAKNRLSPTSIMVNGPKSLKGYDFFSAPQVSSDGRVPYHAIFPPSHSCRLWKVFHSSSEHGRLLGDPELNEDIICELFSAKKKLLALQDNVPMPLSETTDNEDLDTDDLNEDLHNLLGNDECGKSERTNVDHQPMFVEANDGNRNQELEGQFFDLELQQGGGQTLQDDVFADQPDDDADEEDASRRASVVR
eukprot:ANDGO_02242.mRNA.1 hypothetical protein